MTFVSKTEPISFDTQSVGLSSVPPCSGLALPADPYRSLYDVSSCVCYL